MIATLKPYGSISDNAIKYRYEEKGKYFVIDKGFNKIEIAKEEYMKLKCPIRKYKGGDEE